MEYGVQHTYKPDGDHSTIRIRTQTKARQTTWEKTSKMNIGEDKRGVGGVTTRLAGSSRYAFHNRERKSIRGREREREREREEERRRREKKKKKREEETGTRQDNTRPDQTRQRQRQ